MLLGPTQCLKVNTIIIVIAIAFISINIIAD